MLSLSSTFGNANGSIKAPKDAIMYGFGLFVCEHVIQYGLGLENGHVLEDKGVSKAHSEYKITK